jgi:hypothetical protein
MSNFFKSDLIRELAKAEDQKAAIIEALGDSLDHLTLTGNDTIIAVYIEREVNKGGIIMPDERLKESLYQSKVGLVVAAGPDAFRFRGSFPWVSPRPDEIDEDGKLTDAYAIRACKHTPKAGDWVVHFPTDSKLFGLRGVPCRYSLDSTVKMITTAPDEIL